MVASALQAGSIPSTWDWLAAWVLGATVALTAAVVLGDRLVEPDHSAVLLTASLASPPWEDSQVLFELRRAAMAATYENEGVIRYIRVALWLQLIAAVFTSAVAAYSMLLPAN